MNHDTELLVVLKNEMLLAEAKAAGAKYAYERESVRLARQRYAWFSGQKIIIEYSCGPQTAYFSGVEWCSYSPWGDGYEGPVMYGWKELVKGGRGKTLSPLIMVDPLDWPNSVRPHP